MSQHNWSRNITKQRKREIKNNRNTALFPTIDFIEFIKCAPFRAQEKNWKLIDCNHCEHCCANTLRYYNSNDFLVWMNFSADILLSSNICQAIIKYTDSLNSTTNIGISTEMYCKVLQKMQNLGGVIKTLYCVLCGIGSTLARAT